VNKKLLLVPLSFGEGWGEVCSQEFFFLFEFTLSDVEGDQKRKNKFNNAKIFNVLL
jgi:hypothetical protein